MCGIIGIVNDDRGQPVPRELLEAMCRAIHHRGPDDSGVWHEGRAGIGATRLSIIDLAGGHQPIHNEDETVWIAYNGEVYNHTELRKDLEARGHRFYTHTDTETIVHLYEEYGTDCVKHLRGMFAFAIWDKRNESLFLARDRLGIKPLHFLHQQGRLIFGSEIKSILLCPDVPRDMHPPALVSYLAYGYVPEPETMFKDICKLPPGHWLEYKDGRLRVEEYWDVEYKIDKPRSEEYYIERILELLDEAVKIRLMSEVPLGAFLSGGTDSSTVVALMARNSVTPVKTFSIGFEQEEYNELPYARAVATHLGTEHHEEIVNPDAENIIGDVARQFDEPFADPSAIPTYYVSRLAKRHVTVSLSGDGGDELFAGYPRFFDSPTVRRANRLPEGLRNFLFLGLTRPLPEWFPAIYRMRELAGSPDAQYVRRISKGLFMVHRNVFSHQLRDRVETTDPSHVMWKYLHSMNGQDALSKRQYLDTKTYLPGDILTKVDRTSMLVSLEARVPILDHRVVEFAATIPPELRAKGMTGKYLLKKALERLLPKELVYRPKKGFGMPVKFWVKGEWSDMAHELILGERALGRDNFNPRFLKSITAEHKVGRRDTSSILWALMMLEMWYREKIDTVPAH